MQGLLRAFITAGILTLALLPMIGAVSPEAAASLPNVRTAEKMPVAIAQLAASDGTPLVGIPRANPTPLLSEPGMMILVGSALIGLAAVVRRHS